MIPPDDFSDYYAELLDGKYDCVDRIILNAYFQLATTGGGFRTWWRHLEGSDDKLDSAHLMRMAQRFGRRLRAWAKANEIPVIDCEKGTHKHTLAETYLPSDPEFTGLFLILAGRAPAPVWDARRFGENGLDLRRKFSYVKHYSFHIIDPDWGHIAIKISGHPPFPAMVMLNGHEWVEREARRRGLTIHKEENCITDWSDPTALDEVAETLHAPDAIGHLAAVCDRWIYSTCLCFVLTLEEQERSQFRYSYSAFQLEFSRNLRFHRGTDLDQVFQGVIDRTRTFFDLPSLRTLFGWKQRPRRSAGSANDRPPCRIVIERPVYNLTVFKLHFCNLTLKIYDKGEHILRIEVIAHHVRDLRAGRALSQLPHLVAALRAILLRFLQVVRFVDRSFLDAGALDDLAQPSQRGERRLAGVDINQPRIRTVAQAVLALAPKPGGFRVADLAEQVRSFTGQGPESYGPRQAAYDLQKLRGKELVTRRGRSRSYVATTTGIRTLAALLILREKVIKPVLAGAVQPELAPPPPTPSALDLHYRRLCTEMRATFATLGINA